MATALFSFALNLINVIDYLLNSTIPVTLAMLCWPRGCRNTNECRKTWVVSAARMYMVAVAVAFAWEWHDIWKKKKTPQQSCWFVEGENVMGADCLCTNFAKFHPPMGVTPCQQGCVPPPAAIIQIQWPLWPTSRWHKFLTSSLSTQMKPVRLLMLFYVYQFVHELVGNDADVHTQKSFVAMHWTASSLSEIQTLGYQFLVALSGDLSLMIGMREVGTYWCGWRHE